MTVDLKKRMEHLKATKGRQATQPVVATLSPPGVEMGLSVSKTDETKFIQELTPMAAGLVIETEDDYLAADATLGQILANKKKWRQKMYGMDAAEKTGIIPKLRSGLDQLYELNREVEKPLIALEEAYKAAMKVYKNREIEAAKESQRKIEAAAAAKVAEAKALEAAEAKAKTEPMRARLAERRAGLLTQAQAITQQATHVEVRGNSTSVRTRKVANIIKKVAFLDGIMTGIIPFDCIEVKESRILEYYKDDPETVATWPGVQINDDVIITGR